MATKNTKTKRALSEQEIDRIAAYAKKIKMKPWSEDILWLIDELTRAVILANDLEIKVNTFSRALDKLTDGGFKALHAHGPLWTEEEGRAITVDEQEKRIVSFLHNRTCCKCKEGERAAE